MADPGAIVGDRYRLDELIGRGGMAAVYRGWDTRLERPVAVKLLRPEILDDPDLALRFRREAHAATVLRHPNVVACLDAGRDDTGPYLVMELVEGEDLASRLRRESPLPQAVALRIAADVARGLAIAHARGIVHRDVKPGNILLAPDGRAMVTDFGIARLAAEAEATLPGTTLGSVHYFSPEQARGVTTTPASDVYSLGLVLYEMLTGARPFGGDSPAAIAIARVDAPAPSARAVNPGVPAALDAILARALAPAPHDRYANGAALSAALDDFAMPAVADPTSPTTRFALPTSVRGPASRPRLGMAVPLLGLAAGIAVFAAAFGAMTMLGDQGGVAALDATERSSAPPEATAPPITPDPTPATPELPPATPTAAPFTTDPPPTPGPDGVAELCDPPADDTCELPAGRYRSSRFEPAWTVELDDGWAVYRHGERLVVLERSQGYLTIAAAPTIVFDGDEEAEVEAADETFIEALHENGALQVLDQRRDRVAGERAIRIDLVPVDERTPIFRIGDDVYYAEMETITRIFVFEVRGELVLLILEGADGTSLERFIDISAVPVGTLDFRRR